MYLAFGSFALTKFWSENAPKRPLAVLAFPHKTLLALNGTAHIRHQCKKTAVLSYHSFLINSGAEKMNNHSNVD
jgi:hypothetical protein